MTRARDRLIAVAAVVVLAVVSAAVILLVLDAQHAGIETREDLRLEQVQQLADTIDTRVEQIFDSLSSTVGAPGRWNLRPRDVGDANGLRPFNPESTTGALLVDRQGVIVNGSLLRDQGAIGSTLRWPGLDAVLAGEPAVLGVQQGLTTTEPAFALAVPIHDPSGALAGAYVLEVEATARSAFSEEIAQLGVDETGVFSFIDGQGVVTASSDESSLAKRFELPATTLRPGFHRVSGQVAAVADLPLTGWHLVFQQTRSEFEGDLTGPLRTALVLVVLTAAVAGVVTVVALLRRLRTARVEQRRLIEIAAAREEFTSIVSHELRTPVAGLLGFLQTTVDHWEEMSEDERRRAVGRAHQNAARLHDLATEVLDATSVETGAARYRAEPVDLRELVRQAVQIARDANAGRVINLEQPGTPVAVSVDATRITQVVTNLLDNAFNSSPPDAPVEVAVAADNGTAMVSVRDHGTGVAPEDRERIFQKFARGRTGTTRGSGLGLYLAREIVSAHDGRIWVDEPDGAGTALVFTLPLTTADRAG